ncbi:MAG: hypothetical protein Fur006_25060 [Coleofasciculaceae cyanobacterium]
MNYYTLYPITEGVWDYFANDIVATIYVGIKSDTELRSIVVDWKAGGAS